MDIEEKRIQNMEIGNFHVFTKTITEADVILFAGLTGDLAPHHINKEFAKNTMFKERIVHGFLTASLTSACTSKLVAPGGISLGNTFKFLKPVKLGDTITAKAEIIEINEEKKLVKIRTTCENQYGELVLDGETTQLMKVRKEEGEN